MARHTTGKKFFIHAPAVKGIRSRTTGEFVSKRLIRINRPFHGAEAWQHNVFYFWWEFLKRHEGYKDCCDRGGAGRYKKLYADWGNIHAYENFWKWWSEKINENDTRGEFLFAEPDARQIRISDKLAHSERSDTLLLAVPIEVRAAYLVRMFRNLLKAHKQEVSAARRISRARYPVTAKVALASLYQTMRVWDLWQEHKHSKPKLWKYELCDMAGVSVSTEETLGKSVDKDKIERIFRRRKTQAFDRYLRAADDYIENAVVSFPKRMVFKCT